jgi:thiol-disulfide isomerase/thioredoxin
MKVLSWKTVGVLLAVLSGLCFAQRQGDIFLDPEVVDLRQRESTIIITNASKDTLKLEGTFYTFLPYYEDHFKNAIGPQQTDTLKFNFAYPDFLFIDKPHGLRFYNSPGKILHCTISALTKNSATVAFKGTHAEINDYYLAYHNTLGTAYENNRPYFFAGDTVKDFNHFPAIADSISQRSLNFLNAYNKALPSWFKVHEQWRLKYLAGFLKHNVLRSKEFYGGKKIPVRDDYYSFENTLPINNPSVILNTEYLWYTQFYIGHKIDGKKSGASDDAGIHYIDSALGTSLPADILRMQRLTQSFRSSRPNYVALIKNTTFRDPRNKDILDSLIRVRYETPTVGERAPALTGIDETGKEVSLEQFKGSIVIINFWATWCGPCIREFPDENRLSETYKKDGVVLVNVCINSDLQQWKNASQKHGLRMINLYTSRDQYQRLAKEFGINGIPKSILIDRRQRVIDNNFKRASAVETNDIKKILAKNP